MGEGAHAPWPSSSPHRSHGRPQSSTGAAGAAGAVVVAASGSSHRTNKQQAASSHHHVHTTKSTRAHIRNRYTRNVGNRPIGLGSRGSTLRMSGTRSHHIVQLLLPRRGMNAQRTVRTWIRVFMDMLPLKTLPIAVHWIFEHLPYFQ